MIKALSQQTQDKVALCVSWPIHRRGSVGAVQSVEITITPEAARALGVELIEEAAAAECWGQEVGAGKKTA